MTTPMFATTGEAPRIVRVEALAFHDATGRIRHMHHHVVLEGAEPRSIQSMLDEVKAHAHALGNDVSKLRVLHVKEPFNFAAQHRVDVKKGMLVELKAPVRSLSASAASQQKKKRKKKSSQKK
jgi:hypothetical protein